MYHSVAFQTVLVSVMINRTIQGICVNPKIPDAHCFKKQPECVQVIDQIIGTKTKCCHTH